MNLTAHTVLLVIAVILLAVATFTPARAGWLMPAGLALWAASELAP